MFTQLNPHSGEQNQASCRASRTTWGLRPTTTAPHCSHAKDLRPSTLFDLLFLRGYKQIMLSIRGPHI